MKRQRVTPRPPFVNRELSFLEFNQLVVDEAADPTVPLLARLKFCGIVGSNLDEFFMVRVAGLKQQLKSGVLEAGPDGMLPREQLASIFARVSDQAAEQDRIYLDELVPALAAEGIRLQSVKDLGKKSKERLREWFEQSVFGMLTPLAVDPGHPFPFIKNRTLNLAVHLLPESAPLEFEPLLAVVQVPTKLLPRFVDVPTAAGFTVVFLEDLIKSHVHTLFPGMRILECAPFRLVRNWDLEIDEDEQEDLLETVQKELRRRWRLDPVLLEVNEASEGLVSRLRAAFKLGASDVMVRRGPLAQVDLLHIVDRLGRAELREQLFVPVRAMDFVEDESIFTALQRGDVLLHHPYDSYEPVLDLVEEAANDPSVLAIKQTLYRVSPDSPLVRSLITAAENGKQVTALVELKARFDEETNVRWARALEKAGVHVVYGMIGLKTHCKVTMVVRRETEGVRHYVHLGTGNYDERTAKNYVDISYFTCRKDVGADMAAFFNLLTGYSSPPQWKHLVVAPIGLRRHVLSEIDKTRRAAGKGERARIIIKTNALIDAEVITALCQAAEAGVDVVLLVRGPCGLQVGLPGYSKNIRVRVIIDRFLEHARILYFGRGDKSRVYLTSTDIMPRNFDRRVEVMLPIDDPRLAKRIVEEILEVELADNQKAHELLPSGRYARATPDGEPPVRAQQRFIELARQRSALHAKTKKKSKDRKRRKRVKK